MNWEVRIDITRVKQIASGKLQDSTGAQLSALWWPRGVRSGRCEEDPREGCMWLAWWPSGRESACNVGDLGWEDPLEESMATHSSILSWRIPWTEEPGRLQSTGSQRVGHDWSDLTCIADLLRCTAETGEGTGNPLQNSCLENPMDGGAWWAAVHGVPKSQTRLSNFTFTFHFHALEKEMATHSSVLAWRIPGTAEPGGLPSMGSHRVGNNWSDLAAAMPPTGLLFSHGNYLLYLFSIYSSML